MALATHFNALFTCPFHQAVLLTTLLTATATLYFRPRPSPRFIPSPRTHPTAYPNIRTVSTPYGAISTSEFGPEVGKKLLFIHGITTPCIVFHQLATDLAARGYRVLVFDLFGRGGSDHPVDVPYDERLFTTQALYAISASPLHWDRFSVVGYSLGGGIAVAAAEYFKERLEGLVLVAPAGLLRRSSMGLFLRLGEAGYIPTALATRVAAMRGTRKKVAEVKEGDVDLVGAMEWQAKNHPGFFEAFVNSFRNGPIYERQDEWRRVGEMELENVGVIVGEIDDVIDPALLPEMVELLGGEGRVKGMVLKDAAHDLVSARAGEVADFVVEVLGEQ